MFGVARGDAAPALQVQKRIFHQMPAFVQVLIVRALDGAVLAWGNDHAHPLALGLLDERVAVVPPVGDQVRGTLLVDQARRMPAIRLGTRCNKDAERQTMRIHGQMYLGVEPPFVRPMSWLPPTAPVACGWTLQ